VRGKVSIAAYFTSAALASPKGEEKRQMGEKRQNKDLQPPTGTTLRGREKKKEEDPMKG